MRCAHEMCGCEVPAGQEYCSDFCRNPTGDMGTGAAMETSGRDCGCGHDACRTMS
jgi:hypothetical protein